MHLRSGGGFVLIDFIMSRNYQVTPGIQFQFQFPQEMLLLRLRIRRMPLNSIECHPSTHAPAHAAHDEIYPVEK
jgi:hypothetical protein